MKTAVWLALALLSCSAAKQAPYDQAAHSAERAYSAGRYQEAARHWLEAAQHSEEARDRDEAEYRAAASYERGEQYEQALAIYKRIVKQNGERAARAAVATAEVERRRGSEERAQELFLAAMRAYPNSAPAEQALREHLAFVKRGGVQAALSALGPLIEEFSNSDLDERLRYERARLLDETNRTEAARDAYLETARRHPYPEGALWDDALFRAAECEDKLGHPRQAITLLESMLAEREEAHVSGSYERPRYAQGRFKIAELYRDKLADPARARRVPPRLERAPNDLATRRRLVRGGADRPQRRRPRGDLPGAGAADRRRDGLPLRTLCAAVVPLAESSGRAAVPGLSPAQDRTRSRALALFALVFFFLFVVVFVVFVVFVVVFVIEVVDVVVLFFVVLIDALGFRLDVDADLTELRLEQLEELVHVIAAPLVEDVGEKLVKIGVIQTTLDLFDLVLRKGLDDIVDERGNVVLLDGLLRGKADLAERAFIEVDFHVDCFLRESTRH